MDAVKNSDSPVASSVTNRYGSPKRALPKRAKLLLTVVASTLALVWILWVVFGGGPTVTQKILSYNVVDSTQVTVDIAVTKDSADTARCAVKALNSTFAIVGWNVITVGPNSTAVGSENGRTTTVRGEVRTDSLAVTGVVDNCWIVS